MENKGLSKQKLQHTAEAQNDIKVLKSEQSAVPLQDAKSQLNYPAPLSSSAPSGEEKEVLLESTSEIHSKNNKQHWYIARCSRIKRSVKPLYEELVSNHPEIEVYWPQRLTKVKGTDKEHTATPILNDYLFIRSDIQALTSLFKDKHVLALGHLMKKVYHDGSAEYVLVSDNDMLKFKWVCDSFFTSVITIDEKTPQITDGTRVRITDGLLKGREGIIYRYKGNRSFAIKFDDVFSEGAEANSTRTERALPFSGYISFRVSKSLQENMEIIGDDKYTKNMYSVMALVDMLQTHLRNIVDKDGKRPYQYTSAHYTNILILYRIYRSPLLSPELLKKFRWISKEDGVQRKYACSNNLKPKEYVLNDKSLVFPELEEINKLKPLLKAFHTKALDYLAQYAIMNLERELTSFTRPTLSDILLEGYISPFITYKTSRSEFDLSDNTLHDGFTEYIFKIDIDEADADYYAHIGVFRNDNGCYTLITNWSSFQEIIDKFRNENLDDKPENINRRRSLDRMPSFERVLNEKEPTNITFGTHEGIYGTMIQVSENVDESENSENLPAFLQKKIQLLTETSIAILQEIWLNTHYELRKNLPKVWIKPQHKS